MKKCWRGLVRAWAAVLLVMFWCPASLDAQRAEPWRRVREHDGIVSSTRARPGSELDAYRAETELDGSLWEAVAVLDDVARACEWTAHCGEMRRLSRESDEAQVVYARMDAPWPVRDRDVVVRVSVRFEPPSALLISISAAMPQPLGPVSGVVRMPTFEAQYRLQALSPGRARVSYQLEVDPGGTLPDWVKRMVARDIAHDTLDDLRDRVRWARERGLYTSRAAALASSALP